MFWSFILSALHNVTKNSLRVIFVGIESWKVVAFPGSQRLLKTGTKVGLLECFTFLSFSTNPLSYSYTIFVQTSYFNFSLLSVPIYNDSGRSSSTNLPFTHPVSISNNSHSLSLGFQQPRWLRGKWARKAARQISDFQFLLFLPMDLAESSVICGRPLLISSSHSLHQFLAD